MEKQIATIEVLIRDKGLLADKVEDLFLSIRDKDSLLERQKIEMAQRYKDMLKKERDIWMAQEKIRKEKWEADKVATIKAGAF